MKCPVCPFENVTENHEACPNCGADLSPLQKLKRLPVRLRDDGMQLAREGKVEEAIEKLNAAAALGAATPAVYAKLATLYRNAGAAGLGMNVLKRATAPQDPEIAGAESAIKGSMGKAAFRKRIKDVALATLAIGCVLALFLPGRAKQESVAAGPPPAAAKPSLDSLLGSIGRELGSYETLKGRTLQLEKDSAAGAIHVKGTLSSAQSDLVAAVLSKYSGECRIDASGIVLSEPKASAPQWIEYRVKAKESFASVAKKFMGDGGKWREIWIANQDIVVSPRKIKVGQTIRIPLAMIE